MKDNFEEILNKQEIEDSLQGAAEDFLIQKLKDEYVNYQELLDYLRNQLKMTPLEAIKKTEFDFQGKIVPIRHEEEFKIRKHTKSQVPYVHSHDFYELIVVLKGICHQTVGCQNQEQEVKLEANQACLIAPGVAHCLDKIESDEIIFKLHIPQDAFVACFPKAHFDVPYKVFVDIGEKTKTNIVKLLDEYHNKHEFSDMAIKSGLTLIFVELLREKKQYSNAIILDLMDYLKNNYQKATLSAFAHLIGYSSVYIGKIIKKFTNKTFSQIVNEFRLKVVLELLLDSDKSIENIAYCVGYSSASGLYKSFFKQYGVTPIEYKKSIKT